MLTPPIEHAWQRKSQSDLRWSILCAVDSFVKSHLLHALSASWPTVRTTPPVWSGVAIRCVSAWQGLVDHAVKSWSVSTLWTETPTCYWVTWRTGLRPTSHYRYSTKPKLWTTLDVICQCFHTASGIQNKWMYKKKGFVSSCAWQPVTSVVSISWHMRSCQICSVHLLMIEFWFCLQVSTAEDNGILLYNGDNDHIAVELHEGHVKVSYDPGSQQSHAIYRRADFFNNSNRMLSCNLYEVLIQIKYQINYLSCLFHTQYWDGQWWPVPHCRTGDFWPDGEPFHRRWHPNNYGQLW